MSMITATTWVPRGYAAEYPEKQDFDDDEIERISKLAKLQLDDANADLKGAQDGEGKEEEDDDEEDSEAESKSNGVRLSNTNGEIDEDLKEFDLEHYDDPTDDEDMDESGEKMGMFGNFKTLAYHAPGEEDPYITFNEREEEEDEDREELQILPTDNLVLAARVEDEVAHLEVYVYEDDEDNLYVHHDFMLPAIPLAVEWIDGPVGKQDAHAGSRGNYVAVGTMDPDIELWNLDMVDGMYPDAILGQGTPDPSLAPTKPKKKKKSKKANEDYHVDAVLSLAANRQHRNLLASASADKTVKLWDLNTTTCAKSYNYHTDKVCSLAWHPQESTALLSGSYDQTVIAADMRAPDSGNRKWKVESDVETVKWDPHDPNYFYVSTEAGVLHFFDARIAPEGKISKSVWRLQAHDESVSAFDVNPIIPGFLATGSADKQVKLWNVQPQGPSMVVSRDLGVGRVFSTSFAPDKEVGFRLAVAGSKGAMQIWDTSTNAAIRKTFATKVAPAKGEIKERLVGLEEEDDESEDDEEEGTEGQNGAEDSDDA